MQMLYCVHQKHLHLFKCLFVQKIIKVGYKVQQRRERDKAFQVSHWISMGLPLSLSLSLTKVVISN